MLLLLLSCLSTDATPAPAAPPPPDIQVEAAPPPLGEPQPSEGWLTLEPGLELRVFDATRGSIHGDAKIRVLRVDPQHMELVLRGRFLEGKDQRSLTAGAWAEQEGLLAAINASMYHQDHRTSTELMLRGDVINNPKRGTGNTVLVFERRPDAPEDTPAWRQLDLRCGDDLPAAQTTHLSVVQSIRMVSCKGNNTWAPQPKMWSHALIGTDKTGRALLIHARSPWPTHDLVNMLLELPIELDRLQYAEGGPEATMVLRAGGRSLDWIGSYETGFFESDDNHRQWPVPNVIGVVRRQP